MWNRLAAAVLTMSLLLVATAQDTDEMVERETSQPVVRGGIVFKSYCVLCHGDWADGSGRGARLHADLSLRIYPRPADYYRKIIRGGGRAVGRSGYMPPWRYELSREQVSDVVAYLQVVNDQARRGEVVYKTNCVLCHGVRGDGQGRAARLYDPPPANLTLSDKDDAYKMDIIRLGSAEMGRSPAMPPWSDHLSESEMQDLLAYLHLLSRR